MPDPHALTIGAGVEWPRGETQVVQHVDATATQVDVYFEGCAALDEPRVVDNELFYLVLKDGTLGPIGTLLPQGSVNEITLQPGECGAEVIRFQVDKAPYYVLQPDRDIRWRVPNQSDGVVRSAMNPTPAEERRQ